MPWWPDDTSEVELIDGAVGLRDGNDNMAPGGRGWWQGYRSRLEQAAREAGQD